MADRADAADARRDSGHLVKRPPFGEFFEPAHLRDLKLGVRHVAVVVQMNGDLGVTFDAADRIDRDAFHRVLLNRISLSRPDPVSCRPADPSAHAAISFELRRTSRQVHIHFHELVHRPRLLQQLLAADRRESPFSAPST